MLELSTLKTVFMNHITPSPPVNLQLVISSPMSGQARKALKMEDKPHISTHVLDTSRGHPVNGLPVSLYKLVDGRWTFYKESNTNANGRCADLLNSNEHNFTIGRYKIHFDVEKYFSSTNTNTMYPFIEIVFDVKNSAEHYHIPVLLNPFGYTTYRGS